MTLVATAPASFYMVVGGNDHYWRCNAPARAIGAKEFLLPETAVPRRGPDGKFNGREPSAYYSLTQPNEDSAFPWRFLVDRNDPSYCEVEFPEHEGAAVWIRPDLARATLAKAMRVGGVLTVAEADDNYLADPRLNVYLRANRFDARGRLEHLKAMASMDRLVFSTRWLRDEYHKVIRKEFGLSKRETPEMVVCRNNVAAEDWPERVPPGDRLRVGWMGSPSHIWDVDLAWGALMHARNLGCETWMIGFDPTNPWGSLEIEPGRVSPRSQDKIEAWAKVGFRYQPWIKPAKYHRFPLPLDIGLCPLLTNNQTSGKSDVKAIEYSISGAAVIAQNNVVYNRTWKHGETALLVGSPQEMLEAVDLLVKNDKLREELVANAQQYVREERGGKQLREEWLAAVTP